ncbi:ABC exporter membrane fusion protein [Baaleninema simplex]|uniref:ABC exporter membrane fusion protein n=1 Tax=Baaleninema simplex TaxID=2862350 RepID=UPI000349857A|nr:ABC exporter membrane fusion protein [Baaleninema simplex]
MKLGRISVFVLGIFCGSLAVGAYWLLQHSSRSIETPIVESTSLNITREAPDFVSALGRIQPKDEAIVISGSSSTENARVSELLVREGDRVRQGEIIAILDNFDRLQATLLEAETDVALARAELDRAEAGDAKQGQIAAQEARIEDLRVQFEGQVATQEATIARLEAELDNAKNEYERMLPLAGEGAISTSTIENRRLDVVTLQEDIRGANARLEEILESYPNQILEARSTLANLREVRPVDVNVARAKLEQALAAVAKAEAELELAYVRSPLDGRVLKVHTFPGETIDTEGILELAQTQTMYAIAEVYETDITRVRVGQTALVSNPMFDEELRGTVEQIGAQIGKKDVLSSDPSLDVDARVVEVKIRLTPEDSQTVSNLINLQVEIKIEVDSQTENLS